MGMICDEDDEHWLIIPRYTVTSLEHMYRGFVDQEIQRLCGPLIFVFAPH